MKRSEDTEEYFERKLRGCEDCGVPAEAISGEEAREREPSLAGDVDKAIAVPDGAIDPYRLVSRSALRRGRGRHDVGDSCSSISGTCGWKAEKYDLSMAIGEEMFEHVEAARAWTGLTECPTCAMQMEHGTGYEIRHPLEVIEPVLVIGGN